MRPDAAPPTDDHRLAGQVAACLIRTVGLLLQGHLHLHREVAGRRARLSDGRTFVVFRATSCDEHSRREPVTLAVWFHLRGIPPGSRIRRYLFERESILNTVLYAGLTATG